MKFLLVIGISFSLMCCTISPSKPSSSRSSLKANQGAIIFSTEGEESSSDFGTGFVNVANELLALGLATETRVLRISLTKKSANKSTKDTLTLGHSYKTKGTASAIKWHIKPLDVGSYYISSVSYEDYHGLTREMKFPESLFAFEVVNNEWIYLGSFITAFKKMKASKSYTSTRHSHSSTFFDNTTSALPIIADVKWDEIEAKRQSSVYPNYPDAFKRAEYSEELMERYKKYLEERSVEQE